MDYPKEGEVKNLGGNWDDPDSSRYLREQNIKQDYPNLYNRSKASQPKKLKQEEPSS